MRHVARAGFGRELEGLLRTFPAVAVLGPRQAVLRRFWTMPAHWHGGIVNMSEIAASLGLSSPTVSRYLDVMEGLFLCRRLPPFFANVGKRPAGPPPR